MKNRQQVRAAILERGGIFPVQPPCSPPAASPTAAGVQQISAFCSQQRSAFRLFSGSPEKEVSHGSCRALLAAPPAGPAPRPARISVPGVPGTLLCGDAGAGLLGRTRCLQIEQKLLAAVNLISRNISGEEGAGGGQVLPLV